MRSSFRFSSIFLFPVFVGLFFSTTAYSQLPSVNWGRALVDPTNGSAAGWGVTTDAAGNVYTVGYFQDDLFYPPSKITTNGALDVFVMKKDVNGEVIWCFGLGGASNDYGLAIAVNSSGHVFITGYLGGTAGIDMDPSSGTTSLVPAGGNDVFVARYNGNLMPTDPSFFQWAFRAGGTGADQGTDLCLDASGYLYLTGEISGTTAIDMNPSTTTNTITGAGGRDIFVAKYNASLPPSNAAFHVWSFRAGTTTSESAGELEVDGSGNVYVTGGCTGTADYNPSTGTLSLTSAGLTDGFVAKYNGTLLPTSTSFLIWAFRFGGTGADKVESSALTASGNIVIAGYIDGIAAIDMNPSAGTNNLIGNGSSDLFVAQYDGTLLPSSLSFYKWAFNAGSSNGDLALGVAVDGSGSVYVTGAITGSPAVDMDPSTGVSTPATSGAPNYEILIAKYDGNLTPSNLSFHKWSISYGTGSLDYGYDIVTQTSGRIVMTGTIGAQGYDLDPSANDFLDSGGASNDALVVQFAGSLLPTDLDFFEWGRGYGDGVNYSAVNDLVSDAMGNTYCVGTLLGTFDADIGPGVFGLETRASAGTFVAKYNAAGALIWGFTVSSDQFGQNSTLNVPFLQLDGMGNLYLGGRFDLGVIDPDPSTNRDTITSTSYGDLLVLKYDVTKSPSDPAFYKWGFSIESMGPSFITPGSVVAGNDGTVYVCGSQKAVADFDPSSGTFSPPMSVVDQPFIASYNGNLVPSDPGFFKWQFSPARGNSLSGGRLEMDDGGFLYFSTETSSSSFDLDPSPNVFPSPSSGQTLVLCKYDPSFPPTSTSFFQWGSITGAWGLAGLNILYDLRLDPVGKIYLCGKWGGTTIDVDPSANVNSLTGSAGGDVFLISYDGNYAPISTSFYRWSFAVGSPTTFETATSMAVDAAGDVYLAGNSNASAAFDLDPSTGSVNVTPVGSSDIIIAKYRGSLTPSSVGFCDFGFLVGSSGLDKGEGLTVLPSGELLAAGFFDASAVAVDFDPTASSYPLPTTTPSSNAIGFVVQYGTIMGTPLAASDIVLEARPTENGVDLGWTIEGQILPARYEVQRNEGEGFESLHSTNALTWLDADVPTGTQIQYRIAGFDPSGSVSYSNVVTISTSANVQVAAFPNPSSGLVEVVANGPFDFKLLTLTGQLIQTGEAENHCTLDLANLPNGIYLLLVNGNSLKLVKE